MKRKDTFTTHKKAKPFLKWAGGKTQLIEYNPSDDFFDKLYKGFQIQRVEAKI